MDSAGWNDDSGAFEVTVRSDGDSGLTLDPESGVIKWLPTTVGSYRFEGVVTDDGTPPRSVDVAYPINVVNPAEVPGVVDLGESAARAGVEAADLVVGSVGEEFSTNVEAGKVRKQNTDRHTGAQGK